MEASRSRARLALGVVAGVAALALGTAGIAAAASGGTPSTTTPPAAGSTAPAGPRGGQDPAQLGHGPGETLLTGATAAKVTAVVKAALPGASVIRVETDSAGSPYEAHMRKADGSEVTLKVSKDFKVTATEQGFGKGPGGGPPPSGQAPNATAPSGRAY
jgi:hypothetical protein